MKIVTLMVPLIAESLSDWLSLEKLGALVEEESLLAVRVSIELLIVVVMLVLMVMWVLAVALLSNQVASEVMLYVSHVVLVDNVSF